MRRLICRLRGHVSVRYTTKADNDSRHVTIRCRRCDRWFGDLVQPVLVRIDGSAVGLPDMLCYATGEVGECGHDLAECWVCRSGGYCWRCEERCGGCGRFKEAIDRTIGDALAQLDKAVLGGGVTWPTTSDEGTPA